VSVAVKTNISYIKGGCFRASATAIQIFFFLLLLIEMSCAKLYGSLDILLKLRNKRVRKVVEKWEPLIKAL
jgi:hypothetical protein